MTSFHVEKGAIFERLDRGIKNGKWCQLFIDVLVYHLLRLKSNHGPIYLCCFCSSQVSLSRPFHFLVSWISHPEFNRFIRDNWKYDIDITSNLSSLTTKLKKWNFEGFDYIIKRKRSIVQRLANVSLDRRCSKYLLDLEVNLRLDNEKVLDDGESLWPQKLRIDWVQFGDRNTKFSHNKALVRRNSNKISALKINDNWCYDTESLHTEVIHFYSSLFLLDDPSYDVFPLHGLFSPIPANSMEALPMNITLEEVKSALFSMGPLKAPSPDGFHVLFYQSQWDTMRVDVYTWVHGVFSCTTSIALINNTLLVLILKIVSINSIFQFRPISFCNVLYKVVTKIIVIRFRNIFPSLIAQNQVSFVAGRQVTDNIIIAQEIVHSMRTKKGKKSWMAIMVDLEKA